MSGVVAALLATGQVAAADALTASVIKGKCMMPPKGKASSDAGVKAAVEYMLSQSN